MLFMNIHIKRFGTGVPVVFFHGWGFDQHIWSSLIPQLQDNYQLILVDLPGFGLSDMMDWLTFKEYLLEFLPDEFAVVGWSMGGLYATRLAIEEPNRVLYLLNITSSPRFIAEASWPGVAKEVFTHFYKNLSVDIDKTLKEFIALQVNKSTAPFSLGTAPSREGLDCSRIRKKINQSCSYIGFTTIGISACNKISFHLINSITSLINNSGCDKNGICAALLKRMYLKSG